MSGFSFLVELVKENYYHNVYYNKKYIQLHMNMYASPEEANIIIVYFLHVFLLSHIYVHSGLLEPTSEANPFMFISHITDYISCLHRKEFH